MTIFDPILKSQNKIKILGIDMTDFIKDGSKTIIKLAEPIIVNSKFENLGYLCYQLDASSKKLILDSIVANLPDKDTVVGVPAAVEQFLEKNGHCTLVGNFGNKNKKSYGGKGAVRGTMDAFPSLKKGMDTQLMITHLILLNDGVDMITAKIAAVDKDTILRENLPIDQGLESEWYEGTSHLTCWVNDQKGIKPMHSNDLLKSIEFDE